MNRIIFAITALIGIYAISTAPALWWLSPADRAALIAQVEQTHGIAAAQYINSITR